MELFVAKKANGCETVQTGKDVLSGLQKRSTKRFVYLNNTAVTTSLLGREWMIVAGGGAGRGDGGLGLGLGLMAVAFAREEAKRFLAEALTHTQ